MPPAAAPASAETFERARALFVQGVADFEAAHFADAECSFRAALALVPGRASTLANLGATLLRRAQPDAALQALDAALAADPDNLDALGHRGVALGALGLDADALACYDRLVALDPRRVPAWFQRGATLNILGRHQDAFAAFDAVVRLDPGHAEAWLRRGQTLQALGRDAEALPCYERAIALVPALAQAWTNRAILLKDLKRLDEAAAAFEDAIAHGGDPELNRYFLSSLRGDAAPAAPPRHFVESLFDDYAENFEAHLVDVLKYRAHHVLTQALPGLDATRFDAVLDLGCGSGLCGALLAPLSASITGVDLSAKMLEKAAARNVYAELAQSDIVDWLRASERRFDLVIAADVFVYVGDLEPVFEGAARATRAGAVFCFSVESSGRPDGYELRASLRYAHSEAYIRELATRHGFDIGQILQQPIREDQKQPIPGLYVFLIRR